MQFPAPDLFSSHRLLLITDQLPAPADFLLHRFLHLHLRQSKTAKCFVLAVSESLERWKSVASKANANVTHSESFQFIDVFDQHPPAQNPGEGPLNDISLKYIYDLLSAKLSDSQTHGQIPLVILDDITSLEWLGVSLLDLSRFARALRALCVKMDAVLVVRHHIVTPPEPDALLQHLLQLCTYHIEVRPLASGRSGAVSGEICVHLGPSMKDANEHVISRSRVGWTTPRALTAQPSWEYLGKINAPVISEYNEIRSSWINYTTHSKLPKSIKKSNENTTKLPTAQKEQVNVQEIVYRAHE